MRHKPITNAFSGKLALILATIASISSFSGCHQIGTIDQGHALPVPVTRYDPTPLRGVTRIAIPLLENSTNNTRFESHFRRALTAAMKGTIGCEVVDVAGHSLKQCQLESVLRNGYPLQLLAETWQAFRADAMLFGRIDSLEPYGPVAIGITAHLVDTTDARLLVSMNYHWTLADANTRNNYQNYLHSRFPDCRDVQVYMSSPTVFADFVATRIASSLKQSCEK